MKTEFFLIPLAVWNLILTGIIYRTVRHYNRLARGIKQGNLEKILDSLLKKSEVDSGRIDEIKKAVKKLESESRFHFQKASLVRFNPFSDLGGNQSFSLALLDDRNKGVVITSLHGRQTTRVYTKLIDGEKEIKLSEEELKAIKKAKKEKR